MTEPSGSPVDLDALAKLEAATVAGEWHVSAGGIGLVGSSFELIQDEGLHRSNADLIVALRNAAPALIAKVRALRNREQRVREALRKYEDDNRYYGSTLMPPRYDLVPIKLITDALNGA